MGGKPMTTESYEKIVTDRLVFGVPKQKIAESIGRNPSTVDCVVDAFEAVKAKDWDKCAHLIEKYKTPLSLFVWAGEKLEVELSPDLADVYEKCKVRNREYKLQKRQEELAPQVQPTPESQSEPKKEDNTALYLLKLLEAVNKQNELLEQLYDVVIPKWTGDIKDNINCNSDVISQSLKRIDDKLEAIKINVRKRGM